TRPTGASPRACERNTRPQGNAEARPSQYTQDGKSEPFRGLSGEGVGTMATTMIQVDRREIDALHVRAGWAVGAMGPTKRMARALGVSERAVQAWRAGEKPSPLARCAEMFHKLTAAGLSPFAGLAFLEAECAGAM